LDCAPFEKCVADEKILISSVLAPLYADGCIFDENIYNLFQAL